MIVNCNNGFSEEFFSLAVVNFELYCFSIFQSVKFVNLRMISFTLC